MESKGLGDTIARITRATKLDKVAEYVSKLAGAEGCGCDERRQYLNELFPYENSSRRFKALKDFECFGSNYVTGKEYVISKQDMTYQHIIELVRDGNFEEII